MGRLSGVDYSGVADGGGRLAAAGWTAFGVGVFVAAVGLVIPAVIALVVLFYSLSLRGL